MVNFALLNGVLFAASLVFSFRVFDRARDSLLAHVTYTFFCFLVFVVGSQVVLGALGLLDVLWLSLVVYGVAIAIGLKWGKWFLKEFKFGSGRINWLLLVVFGFLIAFGVVELFNSLIQPVWEYDSVSYHLPIVRHWLVDGNLWSVFYSAYAGPLGYYPGTGDLLTLWTVLPIGSDLLANIPNVFLLLVFAVTSYYFARRIGIPRFAAWIFPFLFLNCPIILKEIGTAHVDLFFALSFLYVILFIYEYVKTGKGKDVALVMFAFGLFVGTKYLALPFAVLPFVVFAVYFVKRFKESKKLLRYVGVGILGFLLMGGFWYVRNWVMAGNPIFPAEVKIGSYLLFKGYNGMTEHIMGLSLMENIFSLSPRHLKSMVESYVFRTGIQTMVIAVSYVGMIGLLIWSFVRKRGWTKGHGIELLILLSMPVFFYLYLIAPYTYNDFDANIRYSILVILIGDVLVAYLAWKLKKIRWFFYVLVLGAVVWTLRQTLGYSDLPHDLFNLSFVKEYYWLFLVLVLKILVIVGGLIVVKRVKGRAGKLSLICVCVLAPLILFMGNSSVFEIHEQGKFDVLRYKYPPAFDSFHNVAEWAEENIPVSEKIAYAGGHFHYAFHGTHFEREVYYVNVNDCVDCVYADYKDEGIMAGADPEAWFSNLIEKDIGYLVLFNQPGFPNFEAEWVEEWGERFELVFKSGIVCLYKFLN